MNRKSPNSVSNVSSVNNENISKPKISTENEHQRANSSFSLKNVR